MYEEPEVRIIAPLNHLIFQKVERILSLYESRNLSFQVVLKIYLPAPEDQEGLQTHLCKYFYDFKLGSLHVYH